VAKNLLWHPAKNLALQGHAIRRDAWRKWLVPSKVIWFIVRTDSGGDQLKYVVPQTEFTDKEFLAHDWTDEPWTDPITGLPVTPPNVPPVDPNPPTPPEAPWGGPDNPPGGPIIITPGTPAPPPTRDPTPVPDTPPTSGTPSVYVTFEFANPMWDRRCLLDEPPTPVEMFFTVSVTGGPAGLGLLSVTCQGQTQGTTIWPGGSITFSFTGIEILAGSDVACTATYTIAGGGGPQTGTGHAVVSSFCGSCAGERGCCPGENGHVCGSFSEGHPCCCCPTNYAPALPDCECVYVG